MLIIQSILDGNDLETAIDNAQKHKSDHPAWGWLIGGLANATDNIAPADISTTGQLSRHTTGDGQ